MNPGYGFFRAETQLAKQRDVSSLRYHGPERRRPSHAMPEIARFFGIVIRMFVEPGEPHHRPHFHAYYQGTTGIVAVDVIEVIAGDLPRPQAHLVVAWAEIHREELLRDWELLQAGRPFFKIEPLR